MTIVKDRRWLNFAAVVLFLATTVSFAQPGSAPSIRQFPAGTLNRIDELPVGPFRSKVEGLPAKARQRVLEELRGLHFSELDLKSLHPDAEGALFYADEFLPPQAGAAEAVVPAATALESVLPVNPFPTGLIFHSRPGAPNVLYLNFCGESVSNTAWNTSLNRTVIPAVPFTKDADLATFSATDQAAIKSIWQRVAEDFAPFEVDVTTERPAVFGTRTAHALITRSTDANGSANPSSTAGGVAYVNKFTAANYATYRPAWIYYNNLSANESYIAEAASHEIGHNLGLSHDGKAGGTDYYTGHGSGDISWSPIMGAGYGENVTQWSKGEYYQANNTQDDLAIISGKMPYRFDDHGNAPATASALVITGLTNIASTTPETDPDNLNPVNKGILEQNTDVDVFSFTTGNGTVRLLVNPWIMPSGTRGGNLDVLLELYDANGNLRATNNASAQTYAQIQTNLTAGNYFLQVRNSGAGNPTSPSPSGYTSYASMGQYFISGYIVVPPAASVQLLASVNNAAWGQVTPTNATYAAGASAQIVATPAQYYRFAEWTNDAGGSTNPLVVVVSTNLAVEAIFDEILTTNHPTPHWWLASLGYTNNFESVVTNIGANGVPLWQSYVAGLNPSNPTNQFRLALTRRANGGGDVLNWNTATGRVYTIYWTSNLLAGFSPLAGAMDLPWTTQSFTNPASPSATARYYRIQVRKP